MPPPHEACVLDADPRCSALPVLSTTPSTQASPPWRRHIGLRARQASGLGLHCKPLHLTTPTQGGLLDSENEFWPLPKTWLKTCFWSLSAWSAGAATVSAILIYY